MMSWFDGREEPAGPHERVTEVAADDVVPTAPNPDSQEPRRALRGRSLLRQFRADHRPYPAFRDKTFEPI